MKNSFREIQGKELDSLIEKAKDNAQVKLVLKELKEQEIVFEDHTVLGAKKFESSDLNVTNLTLGFKGNKIKLLIVYSGTKTTVTLSIMQKINEIDIINSYVVVNKNIKHSQTYVYDEKFKEALEEINKKELPKQLDKETIVRSNLPCIYGNWCGPGCSGPDAPISKVDECCKKHDECYGEKGYFNCDCDKQLIQDLARYYYMGSEWAIVITEYFKIQYKHNCK